MSTERRVAAVVIPEDQEHEKFLVARRRDDAHWEFPGGKFEEDQDQDILDTARREIKEELGIDISPVRAAESSSFSSGGHEIVPVLAEHSSGDLESEIELSGEHTEFQLIRPEQHEIDLGQEMKCLRAFGIADQDIEGVKLLVSKVLIRDDEGKFLAIKVDPEVDHRNSGKWELPGGRIMKGENRFQAAKREMEEEMSIEVSQPRDVVRIEVESGHLVDCYIVYFEEFDIGEGINLGDKHSDFRWVSAEEFSDMDWHADAGYDIVPMKILDQYLSEDKIYR